MKIDFKVRKRRDGDIISSCINAYNSRHFTPDRYTEYIPRFDLFWIFNYTTEKMINTNVYCIDFKYELNEIFNSKLHNYVE